MSGLQLYRKEGSKIVVWMDGKELVITVEESRTSGVRLSFQGHKDFEVYRQEIAEKALHRA